MQYSHVATSQRCRSFLCSPTAISAVHRPHMLSVQSNQLDFPRRTETSVVYGSDMASGPVRPNNAMQIGCIGLYQCRERTSAVVYVCRCRTTSGHRGPSTNNGRELLTEDVLREATVHVTDDSQMCYFMSLISSGSRDSSCLRSADVQRTPAVSFVDKLLPASFSDQSCSAAVQVDVQDFLFREKNNLITSGCRPEHFHLVSICSHTRSFANCPR